MAVRFPKTRGTKAHEGKPAENVGEGGRVVEQRPGATKAPDGMLPEAAVEVAHSHVPVQGNSLIERTQRYLASEIARNEAQLAPLVSTMQSNGWFSPETLAQMGRSTSVEEISRLIASSAGAGSLGVGANPTRLAEQILAGPAKPSTVLLLASNTGGLARFGATLPPGDAAVREISQSLRHLDNLTTYVEAGFNRYTTVAQIEADLKQAQATATAGLFDRLAPLTAKEVGDAQLEYSRAVREPDPDAARAKLAERMLRRVEQIAPDLLAELRGQDSPLPERIETLLERQPYGSDFEKARDVVSLFFMNGTNGAPLHALFDEALRLDFFLKGGFIPGKVSEGSELW